MVTIAQVFGGRRWAVPDVSVKEDVMDLLTNSNVAIILAISVGAKTLTFMIELKTLRSVPARGIPPVRFNRSLEVKTIWSIHLVPFSETVLKRRRRLSSSANVCHKSHASVTIWSLTWGYDVRSRWTVFVSFSVLDPEMTSFAPCFKTIRYRLGNRIANARGPTEDENALSFEFVDVLVSCHFQLENWSIEILRTYVEILLSINTRCTSASENRPPYKYSPCWGQTKTLNVFLDFVPKSMNFNRKIDGSKTP